MDKAQGELIKSYYHARNIAASQSHLYGFEDYEIKYGFENFDNETIIEYDLFSSTNNKANFFNKLLNTDKFNNIMSFNIGDGNIAIAILKNKNVFINKKGEESIEHITKEEIVNFDSNKLTIYYNQLSGDNKFFKVNRFKYANKTISSAYLNKPINDLDTVLINRQGKESIEGITDYDIKSMNYTLRATYYNQLLGVNKFSGVFDFDYNNEKFAFAELIDRSSIYINKHGKQVDYKEEY